LKILDHTTAQDNQTRLMDSVKGMMKHKDMASSTGLGGMALQKRLSNS